MYGIVVELQIDEQQADRAIDFLHQVAVPMIKQGAGFKSGTWMRSRDGLRTRSVIIYEDEQSADDAAERAHGKVRLPVRRPGLSPPRSSRSWPRLEPRHRASLVQTAPGVGARGRRASFDSGMRRSDVHDVTLVSG